MPPKLIKTNGEAGRLLNLPMATVADWMSKYWFYKKLDNPIILTLKSKV
jgi:hypothetical protein